MADRKYRKGLERLRELNVRFEQLETRAQTLPPGGRTEIDTRSEALEEKKRLLVLLFSRYENAGDDERPLVRNKIEETLEELRYGIDEMTEMIERTENG